MIPHQPEQWQLKQTGPPPLCILELTGSLLRPKEGVEEEAASGPQGLLQPCTLSPFG